MKKSKTTFEWNLHGSEGTACLGFFQTLAEIQSAEAPCADNEILAAFPNDGHVLW